MTGHPAGEKFKDVLDAVLTAVNQQKAVFPLSDAIYLEIIKIGKHRQRRNLCEVIELVSGYSVITSRSMIYDHEIEAMLDHFIGPNPHPIDDIYYLDWGDDRAFGVDRRLVIMDREGEDVTDKARLNFPGGPEGYERFEAQAQLHLNRKAIEGPSKQEEPKLRAAGWNPEKLFDIFKHREIGRASCRERV